MPNYTIKMDVPRGGVHPSRASTAGALPSGDGRWPWARPENRSMSQSPNGVPKNRPKIPRRSKSEAGFPWGRTGATDLPDLSGGLGSVYRSTAPVGEHTPGPFFDLDRAGGKYRTFSNQIEFMPERYALLREGSEKRLYKEGGEAYGLYMSTDKDLGPGQHVQHGTWLDPNIEVRKEPKGFCQGSSHVGWPWGRDGQLRIPEDKNSWIILNGLGEPQNELLKVDEHLRKWKANGQRKGVLIMKAQRQMAPWLNANCRY